MSAAMEAAIRAAMTPPRIPTPAEIRKADAALWSAIEAVKTAHKAIEALPDLYAMPAVDAALTGTVDDMDSIKSRLHEAMHRIQPLVDLLDDAEFGAAVDEAAVTTMQVAA